MAASTSVYGDDCVQGHTALIYDRGGTNRWRQLVDLTSVRWGRTRDAFTDSEIVLAGRSCDAQANVITGIEPRRHELVLWRGAERVYEGPILDVKTYRDRAVIRANDIGEYLKGTTLSQDYPWNTGETVSASSALMTERVADILGIELTEGYNMVVGTGGAAMTVYVPRWEELDPPANVLPHIEIRRSDTLLTRSNTLAFEMSVAEHLQNLSEGGLDFTTVGRKLLIWDSAQSIGRTRVVTDADFDGELEIIKSGSDHYSISHVSAQRDPDEDAASVPSVGNAGGQHPYYGVWTNIVSLSSEDGDSNPTQDALNSQAQRDQVGRTPVPLEIRVPDNASLRTGRGLGINTLVPGVIMPVRADMNIRQVQQDQRLDKITVTETAEGEQIAVTLSSWGQTMAVA
ncbi:minor tail protein [Microbacterium phage Ramiel05]|uniref:Minor tail protein n=7 Tax=Caudoviricetes TaxID=2731619 RepID=A0A2U8UPY4_9CAUD|nr:minor tail protein [Microbacterium phage Paschalis]QDF19053.1 minor tail protein [Microbacterium phage Busephilis]QDP45432.1 minor tail protein [Microbacterium phage PiperSansNom]QGH76577.1 minor tail protein [Microbacterium phage Antares]QOC58063.1 minor tail protein [Microbacterium phage Scumberland]QTF81556.1 minor tail protein [Microbacterium phage Pulchra]QXN74831.1 minor tail protein [Microbacterium phage Phrancesco]UQT01872.1 minor tail protein [Microbacterium phage Savannah]URM86